MSDNNHHSYIKNIDFFQKAVRERFPTDWFLSPTPKGYTNVLKNTWYLQNSPGVRSRGRCAVRRKSGAPMSE